MDLGERSGNRAVGIGEVPYFDPQSTSRAEALGLVKPMAKVAANHGTNGVKKRDGSQANGHKPGHAIGLEAPCSSVREMVH